MSKNPKLIVPAVIAGVLLLVVAAVYLIDSASSLPSFFPGHQAGSSHHHIKHGIAAAAVGLAALVLAWFQTEPKSGRPTTTL